MMAFLFAVFAVLIVYGFLLFMIKTVMTYYPKDGDDDGEA